LQKATIMIRGSVGDEGGIERKNFMKPEKPEYIFL
jgi:hypothetical protein